MADPKLSAPRSAIFISGDDPHEHLSVRRYLATRLTRLKPPMNPAPHPLKALSLLNFQQWMFFLVAFAAWTWDAFDFFTVTLTVSELAKQFHKKNSEITWGITLVLMLRPIGAIAFGIVSDRWGRKWPFVVNNILFIILELATGFCNTYDQFLACRALFGLAMGGLYGNATTTALEDCPEDARGIVSGILQQGYSFGYLLATLFARALVNTTPHGWRPLFWFGAGPPILIIIFRLCLPENQEFRQRQAIRNAKENVTRHFLAEGKIVLKKRWLLFVYLSLMMTGFNFLSHGSQDLYPTMLKTQLEFSKDTVTITQVVANLGAILGGTLVGWASQIFGRRLSIIAICILGATLIYPYTFTHTKAVMAAAFFQQFCVQGAWGVVPIYLLEISPGSLRTFIVGTSYQLGSLISSASSTIEATLGEKFPLPPLPEETERYNYGLVICIFMACAYTYVIIITFLGPEYLGRKMDAASDHDFAEAAGGHAAVAEFLRLHHHHRHHDIEAKARS